jgi:hypothetical protein
MGTADSKNLDLSTVLSGPGLLGLWSFLENRTKKQNNEAMEQQKCQRETTTTSLSVVSCQLL